MNLTNIKQSNETQVFLSKFSDQKRIKVAQYLMAIGVDLAKKLNLQPGSAGLYQKLSSLAKDFEKDSRKNDHNNDLKGEIRKIQDQLAELNDKFAKKNSKEY